MIESEHDPQTPAAKKKEEQSTPSKRRRFINHVWIVNAFIIIAALIFIFFLWPNKPAWLQASPLFYKIQPSAALLETPAIFSMAEASTNEAIDQIAAQATITPAPTLSVASATPASTITAAPTSEPPSIKPSPNTSTGLYKPQEGSPFYISAKTFQGAEQGCNWIGVAGQVFDSTNTPQNNLVVVVDGKLGEKDVNLTSTTGSALLYGPAGYEINISLKPQQSEGSLTIQLFHELGKPLSEKVPLATYTSCEKNLAIVNFVEIR